MKCPKCEAKLRSVSSLTHGCIWCQRLYLMLNGRLVDHGPWPVSPKPKKRDDADWIALIAWLVWIALMIWITIGLKF